MNWAWWDGKMPVEHYREEHALDTESLRGANSSDSSLGSDSGVPKH
jgi:hypothetical protein